MIEKIKQLTQSLLPELIDIRNHLHQYPELGTKEYMTQAYIIKKLEEIGGYEVKKIADTGVLATFKGKKGNSQRCIGVRADIDALPIQETNQAPYASKNCGVMHACGHDAHTTILLGLAKNLASMANEIDGFVKLFFQPAEETVGGAKQMIEEGCLENPHVDVVIGLHVEGAVPVGTIWIKKGAMYACADMVTIEVFGQSSHAAHPEQGIDAIMVSSAIITQLQTVVSRRIGAHDVAVLSFGTIHGGEANNIISQHVKIDGTLRTLDPEVRKQTLSDIERIVTHVAKAHGAQAKLIVTEGYPALINHDQMVDFVSLVAKEAIGESNVLTRPHSSLGAEDFAFFTLHRPSCFYNLGISNPNKGVIYHAHTPNFDVEPDALYYGTLLQTLLVSRYLNQ